LRKTFGPVAQLTQSVSLTVGQRNPVGRLPCTQEIVGSKSLFFLEKRKRSRKEKYFSDGLENPTRSTMIPSLEKKVSQSQETILVEKKENHQSYSYLNL